jgi:hypothetical protein
MELLGIDGKLPKSEGQSDMFALVNPRPSLEMQSGDQLYVICPGKYVDPEDLCLDGKSVQDDGPANTSMPPLPSCEHFDMKGKEVFASRLQFQMDSRSQTQTVNKMSVKEQNKGKKVVRMITV